MNQLKLDLVKTQKLIQQDLLEIWVDNPNKEINFVIEEALSKNIYRKNRASYYFGTDLIGNGLEDVIAYLKDKKNQDIYLSIMSEIKSK